MKGLNLIIESGATKTSWLLLYPNGESKTISTSGINVATMPAQTIQDIVDYAVSDFGNDFQPEEIHFYAAGLIVKEGEKVPVLAKSLHECLVGAFPNAEIEYASDLLAAARAVCRRNSGIAGILGTGSNSCFYDDGKIVKNVRSAGFILGDEGSGACLGKLFISDFLKGLVPDAVAKEFSETFPSDYATVVSNVYRGEAPSKYLGTFAPWILEHYDSDEYVHNLVEKNFRNFMERVLCQYDTEKYEVGIVGGFGFANQEIIRKVGSEYGIRFRCFLRDSMEGLQEYHK